MRFDEAMEKFGERVFYMSNEMETAYTTIKGYIEYLELLLTQQYYYKEDASRRLDEIREEFEN